MRDWFGALPLICLSLLALAYCRKPSTIGAEILDPGEVFGISVDTFTLGVRTELDDYGITSSLNKYHLGQIIDSNFGTTSAGIFTQIKLGSGNLSLGDNPRLDSVVLTLRYADTTVHGNRNSPLTISVHALTEPMPSGNIFYRDFFPHHPETIGRLAEFVPSTRDSVEIGGLVRPAHVRIRLHPEFEQALFAQNGQSGFVDDEGFLAFLPGIYIKAESVQQPGDASLVSFNLLSSLTAMTMYYSNDADTGISHNFQINSTCAFSNHYVHQYDGHPAIADLDQVNPKAGIHYLQGLSGLRLRVTLPDITALGAIAVNHAELTLTVIRPGSPAGVAIPAGLRVSAFVHKDTLAATSDDLIAQIAPNSYTVGGLLGIENIGGTTYERYRINMAHHFQLWNKGLLDPGVVLKYPELVIRVRSAEESPLQVLIGGNEYPDLNVKMKFRVIYSRRD